MIGHAPVHNDTHLTHEVLVQVERILRSGEFSGSELLRNLLSFLAKRAVERPGEGAKEYELAVDVLGKAEGFDTRLDSAVRVHTSRLRSKLAEYYMTDGAEDPVIIEVPKGSYLVTWHYRSGYSVATHVETAPEMAAPSKLWRRQWRSFGAGVVAVLLAGCVLAGAWLLLRPAKVAPLVESFWRPFLDSADAPLVVFSNHRFVGTSAIGLRRFQNGVDDPSQINDTYSGTGTVMAAYQLTALFGHWGRPLKLKRAELLTWDEAQNANVIFIGSPEANAPLRQFPQLQQFAFKPSDAEPRFGVGGVINVQPQRGEEPVYFASGKPYTSDYAVIAMLPGLKPDRKVLILAGTNTYGVQAAADFVCRADMVGELLSRLGAARGRMPDFEALLQVKVSGGVPVQSQLVLLRPHKASPASR